MTDSGLSNIKEGEPTDAQSPDAKVRRPSRKRRAAIFTARGVGLLVAEALTLVLIALFAILIRLQGEPIDLGALAPTVEAAVNKRLDGRIEIGGATLSTHRHSEEPRILLQNVRLRDADGRLVLSAPQFSARFDMSKLIQGVLAPTSLTLIGPTAILTRAADGSFKFGIGDADPDSALDETVEDSPIDAFSSFTAGFAFPDRRIDPFKSLNSIAVRNAYLIYRDEVSGRVWRAPGSFLRVWAGGEGARATARIKLAGAQGAPTELILTGRRFRGEDRVQLKASFEHLRAEDLASQIRVFEWLQSANGALDGGLDLDLAPDGSLNALSGHLRADSVIAEIGGEDRLLDYAEADVSYDVEASIFNIEALEASALGVTAELAGAIALRLDDDQQLTGADVTVEQIRSTIARPDLFDAAVKVRGGEAELSIDLRDRVSVELRKARVTAGTAEVPDAEFTAVGSFTQTPLGDLIDLRASSDGFRIRQAVALWPRPLGTSGRAWVAENIPDGKTTNVRASFNMAPGGEPEAVLAFDYYETTSTYLKPMPPIIDARGSGGIRDGKFHLTMDSGAVATEDGVVDISGSTLEMRNLLGDIPIAHATIRSNGPSAAALNIIDHEPLKLPSKLGLAPSLVGGEASTQTVLEFPLLSTLQLDDILLDIDARLTELAMTVPNTDVVIEADQVSLAGDQTGMEVTGQARVDGQPATVTWREKFIADEGPRRTLDFTTRYTREQAVAAGVPSLLLREGAAAVSGQLSFRDNQPPRLRASADMTGLNLVAENIGWRKEIDAPATMSVEGAVGDTTALNVNLDAPGFEGEGVLRLGDGRTNLVLKRLSLAGVGDFTGEVDATARRIDVILSSPSVDLERFLSEGAADASGLETPELSITLNADGAHLTGKLWAGALSGNITIKDGQKRAKFNGLINGDAPFAGDFKGTDSESLLVIRSDEAGRALKALGALESGKGGALTLKLRLTDPGAPITGDIHIENIVVTEAPVLAEMLSVASLVGAVDKLTSGGVTFTTIEADFRAEDSLVFVSDAAAYGPTVGLTAQGSYDLDAEKFNLSGSISPAYVINGLLNAVPILGEALTGGEGEGVFGIAYELTGPASAPEISVNPLSALAVGPFRRLFSGTADDGSEEETPAGSSVESPLDRMRRERDQDN